MYRRILAAVNEHLNSEVSAHYALSLARAAGAKLYLCFVAEKDFPRRDFDRAEEALKRLFVEAEEAGIDVEAITDSGDPVEDIGKIVRREKIDLVFAATRREDIERRFYAGTVARRLSLKLPCSVALVRVVHMGRVQPRNVLVPLKGRVDRVGERAYFAAKIAECCGARVIVIHITKPVTKFFHGEIHLPPATWEERMPKGISEFMDALRTLGVEPEGRLAPGLTARDITIEAAIKRHDLIIMGATQRGLLNSLLKGNPVEEVLRETTCDLIILNPRHED